MKTLLTYLSLISFFILLISCSDSKPKVDKIAIATQAKTFFSVIPDKMPGSENDTEKKIALGKKLYFDDRLSANDEQSCNTCHPVDDGEAGADNFATSPGAKGDDGTRNSPTVLNAGFHFVQFWDGRSPDLKDQAKGPILNPIEMAMPDSLTVEKKLGAIEEYQMEFANAFPNDPKVSYDNIAEAIAAFERTLITKDRFDMFLKGNVKALSDIEAQGLKIFMDKQCTTCHTGSMIGANMYQKMGLYKEYTNKDDMGRFDVTQKDEDKYMFKVPSLRNVALTYPYFHDGAVEDLESAVGQMSEMQLTQKLTLEEIKKVTKFLEALSDIKLSQKQKTETEV